MNKFNLESIHCSEFEKEIFRLTNDDIKALAKKKDQFVESNCPACHGSESSNEYDLFGLSYARCNSCATVFLNPCPDDKTIGWYLDTSKALKKWREDMPKETVSSRKKSLYKDRCDYVIDQMNKFEIPHNNLVDIGGGSGELAEELNSRKFFSNISVIEPQEINFSIPGVEVVNTTFENYKPTREADVIISFEVLEHIIDPNVVLKQVRNCLSKNGAFIFSTPNIDGFETKSLGLLSRALWFDHIRLYNVDSLKMLLDNNGFDIVNIETPGTLDFQLVLQEYQNGNFSPEGNMALQYLLDEHEAFKDRFQQYLTRNNASSHMRCVAKRRD